MDVANFNTCLLKPLALTVLVEYSVEMKASFSAWHLGSQRINLVIKRKRKNKSHSDDMLYPTD